MFPYFYPAVMPQYCPSVCPPVTFRYRDHICWNTSKIISPPNSDKIVMWRFLRNRRPLLCLHTIFRALIYWAHRAVVLAIAWHLVLMTKVVFVVCSWSICSLASTFTFVQRGSVNVIRTTSRSVCSPHTDTIIIIIYYYYYNCSRLKSHLFSLSYRAFWLFSHLYSARTATRHFADYNRYYI